MLAEMLKHDKKTGFLPLFYDIYPGALNQPNGPGRCCV